MQVAVYLLALRTLQRLGLDPDILSPSVIPVAPRNHNDQKSRPRAALEEEGLRDVVVNTANKLQGLPIASISTTPLQIAALRLAREALWPLAGTWGRTAVALDPPELREAVAAELAAALGGYGDGRVRSSKVSGGGRKAASLGGEQRVRSGPREGETP